ncbi:MAG: SET domain-containing protein-lysine N-methyltransferase [Candidatus Babeliales bacterium]|nr:SET domain-containing protein-lysine N-methyltransferase [Candidatus Babeliales bacterium]
MQTPKKQIIIFFTFLLIIQSSLLKALFDNLHKIEEYQKIETEYPSYVDQNHLGLCLKASIHLEKGTVVATANFEKTDKNYIADHPSEEYRYIALMNIDDNGNPICGKVRGKWAFCNHSCEPNCDITDKWEIVTNRKIDKDEELTTSYDALVYNYEWPAHWNFECKCLAEKCKKQINKYRLDIIYPIKKR